MKQATFKDWTLTRLDQAFGLKQIWQSDLMNHWTKADCELSETDKEVIFHLQQPLIRGGRAWNEAELENKFISPLIMQAHIDDEKIFDILKTLKTLKKIIKTELTLQPI